MHTKNSLFVILDSGCCYRSYVDRGSEGRLGPDRRSSAAAPAPSGRLPSPSLRRSAGLPGIHGRLVRTIAALVIALPPLGSSAAPAAATRGQSESKPVLRVTLLGTGNPRPSASRSGPATLIEAGTQRVLIDAGRGVATRLFELGRGDLLAGARTLLLTHLHSDHTVGIPDLWLTGWIFGRRAPLEVYGPPGTAALMAGLEQAYAFDVRMRRDIDERLPPEGVRVDASDIGPGPVFARDGLTIVAFAVDHRPVEPAYGYRVDYAGRSAVFSGDTRYAEAVARQATGVDLLVHEVVSPEVERRRTQVKDPAAVERIIAHHTTPEDAGRIFALARPRLAVYSHIVPSPTRAKDLVRPTRKTYEGRLEVGYDFMMITIGDRVQVSKRGVIPDD